MALGLPGGRSPLRPNLRPPLLQHCHGSVDRLQQGSGRCSSNSGSRPLPNVWFLIAHGAIKPNLVISPTTGPTAFLTGASPTRHSARQPIPRHPTAHSGKLGRTIAS